MVNSPLNTLSYRVFSTLEEITDSASSVRSFYARTDKSSGRGAVLVTFTPEGIYISGDGVAQSLTSKTPKSLEWFSGDLTEEDLYSQFGNAYWQPEHAIQALRLLGVQSPESVVIADSVEGTYHTLLQRGMSPSVAASIGYYYDPEHCSLLWGLHLLFRRKETEWN